MLVSPVFLRCTAKKRIKLEFFCWFIGLMCKPALYFREICVFFVECGEIKLSLY